MLVPGYARAEQSKLVCFAYNFARSTVPSRAHTTLASTPFSAYYALKGNKAQQTDAALKIRDSKNEYLVLRLVPLDQTQSFPLDQTSFFPKLK